MRFTSEGGDSRAGLPVKAHALEGSLFGGLSAAAARAPVQTVLGPGTWDSLATCEVWAAAAVRDLDGLSTDGQQALLALFAHCASATTARPSAKWLKTGRARIEAVGRTAFRQALSRWLPLADLGRRLPMVGPSWENVDEQQRMHQVNATVLRGLLLVGPEVADAELTRAVGKTVSAYRKVRGIGPRAPKVGNAGVYALSRMNTDEAVGPRQQQHPHGTERPIPLYRSLAQRCLGGG